MFELHLPDLLQWSFRLFAWHHIDLLHLCLQRLLSSTRGPRLSEDAFEGVIDSFEKGLHRVLEHRTELWPNVIEASREAPDIESIFSVEDACGLPVSFLLMSGLSSLVLHMRQEECLHGHLFS